MICVDCRIWRREVELVRARRSRVAIDERCRSRGNEMKRSHKSELLESRLQIALELVAPALLGLSPNNQKLLSQEAP
jgi:hypothetical protein